MLKIRRVDVIIVCFNSDLQLLQGCIASVVDSYAASEMQGNVILVDNASVLPVSEVMDCSGLVVFRMDENVGFGRAVNYGVSMSDADFVLMLNPDAAIKPNGLRLLVDASESVGRGIIGGWLQKDGRVQSDAYMQWDFSVARMLNRRRFSDRLAEMQSDLIPVDKVCGGALFARKSILHELGPFDPRFFLYGEDADLSRRAARKSISLFVARRVEVEHIAASSQKEYGTLVERARADAAIRITSYHRGRLVSLLQRIELATITLVGAVAGGASSSNRRARLARLGQIWRWGLRAETPAYRP
ncbi:hypothetical protein CH278_05960 [Rhodococcus sp. 05-2254-5]|uniref:glycosyltransferase family 2 protein n=1 Tax=unclassified Rhodococcus (in: high G+C Gram-positive bacteria) TaxID=192944 RepID=UPI000B9B3681|nr:MULTISPECIES: glycosyltransferase [unclassified Rhodococcus (in: high G+C Gram-positive bacteria)]OZE36432.1 hypothetical protein CH278_05960 [Rhodococcus sp. 05-2254-5]OZE62090.1 hypothetical protein CH269_02520 [Rhodococcus sp. 05-2254-1]